MQLTEYQDDIDHMALLNFHKLLFRDFYRYSCSIIGI